MISASQIREQLARFLDRKIELNAFHSWLAQNTWDISKSKSVAAESLAYAIEEIISEYADRHLSAVELRQELLHLLNSENTIVTFSEIPQNVFSFKTSAPLILVPVKL